MPSNDDDAPDDAPDAIAHALTVESTPDDDLGSAASLLRGLAAALGRPPGTGPLRREQIVAGKYRIERAIGEGGMGVVYRARDLRLDRDVAIKVGTAVSAPRLARLEGEAQALARLAHPNVVVVYEVGEVGGQVFVAMELVTGGTARTWLRARRRETADILALLCAAGDGLAAAHAAGIVHRDFKPDNVLVGEDGRPRVADFGLARQLGDSDDPAHIAGTPAYMAPEQLAGGPSDARVDQFAFCVALWEALHGKRPDPGRHDRGGRKLPRHVDAALRHGLELDPDARWPTLRDLLAELRRDPARARRRVGTGLGLVAALVAAVVVPLELRSTADPCSGDAEALASTWNPARENALPPAMRTRVADHARAWIAAHHDACVATRISGTQSVELLDRRMLCLEAARAQLDAIVASNDEGALALLADLAGCADLETLGRQAPLPTDRLTRAAIERTYAELATVRVSALRHQLPDPTAAGDHVLASATATHWPPLVALASRTRAELAIAGGQDELGRTALQDAANLALAAGEDREAAWAMADLSSELARGGKASEARSWLDLARAIWQRTGRSAELGARLQRIAATMR